MIKIISTYTLTQYINKGQYGKVYKAINHTTQQYVAIKMIELDKFIEKPKLISLTKQQVQILTNLENNHNIIKLKQIIKSNKYLYLVYQYCQNGTLQEFIRKKGKLPEKQAIKIFRQLINAYKSLYQNNIVHRDIKPDNIFFKGNVLKLADFGFCKRLKFTDDLTQTSLGSPLYMAPQVLNNDVYGSKADLWSCGIILYQMLFGVPPYSTCNIKQLLFQYTLKDDVPMPPQKRYLSPVLIEMLMKMLCKDQFRRTSWQDFLYEYQFTQEGEIKNKQKDFEYDLMKLMKRNSSNNSTNSQQKKVNGTTSTNKILRFDWSKITDLNSSVHSEQCNQQISNSMDSVRLSNNGSNMSSRLSYQGILNKNLKMNGISLNQHNNISQSISTSNSIQSQQQQISSLYVLKKTIKNYQDQHSKLYQLLTIIQAMLQSNKNYQYDSRVVYFLVYNLQHLLKSNIQKVTQYIKENTSLLQRLPEQKNKLERLKRIFQKQYEDTNFKINSIKTTLITLEDVGLQVFRYPRKDVLRKVMKEYVQNYELEVDEVLSLMDNQNRQQTIRLLRILWGVQLLYSQQNQSKQQKNNKNNQNNQNNKSSRFKYSSILSIKQQTSKKQVAGLINRYLVEMGI